MIKKTFAPLALFAVALLCSCGDDHLVKNESGSLQQFVYATSDGFTGDVTSYFDPLDTLYVEQGQTVHFYAGYSLGKEIYTDETLQDSYSEIKWKIGSDEFDLSSFRYTFKSAGQIDGYLKASDNYGDTLYNAITVFVNKPNSISLQFPYNGYNQADPLNIQETPLQWTISGLDPWETSYCQVFASFKRDSVWFNRIGITDCEADSPLHEMPMESIKGIGNIQLTLDSSFTVYWGVKLISKSESGREYRDSSEIFHFSTKILNELSTVKIPIVYDDYRDIALLQTEISLIAANGDTLQKATNDLRSNTIVATVSAQSKVKLFIRETLRPEYAAESTTFDIPANTVFTLDTIHLSDKVSPQVSAFETIVAPLDSIQFLVYDDGASVNPGKIKVIVGADTIDNVYRNPMLKFYANCPLTCKVRIIGEDYANNSFPNTYWQIANKATYYAITGPYSSEVP